jgi:hypothetical protein
VSSFEVGKKQSDDGITEPGPTAGRRDRRVRCAVVEYGPPYSESPLHYRMSDSSFEKTHSAPRLPLRLGAVLLVALGLLPVANLLSAGRSVPWWQDAVQEWTTTGAGLVVVALLIAHLLGDRADAITTRGIRLLDRPSSTAFRIGVALLVFALSAFFAQYCFAGMPYSVDEVAQRWHAQILLAGRLYLPTEPHPEFFSTNEVLDAGGRWFSQFPVGGPAVFAIGLLLGAPWLVNPALAAFTAWNLHRFASRTFSETIARGATLLFALSPFVLLMSASEMNHVATLALVSLALAELARWATADDPRAVTRSAIILGLAVGGAAAVRPMDAALVAVSIGIFQAWVAWREPARRRSLLLQCLAGAIPVALLLYANARTTGHPMLFGYDALNGAAHRPGFHVDPQGVPFTPRRALMITSGYLMKLNRYLFEWPIPGLLVIVAALLTLRRASRWDMLMLGLVAAIVGGYAFYWFDGFFVGPRFLYSAIPAFVIFAARAPGAVSEWLGERTRWPAARRAALLLVPLCVAYAWAVPTGVSSVQLRAFYYRHQRAKLKVDVDREVAAAGLDHALVFVPESWHARLVARLRALGMRPLDATHTLQSVDACALQGALDAEDSLPGTNTVQRLSRVLERARAAGHAELVPGMPSEEVIALVPGAMPTAACLRQAALDQQETMPYALFLSRQEIDAQGRVGGPVVFVRDFGERNELLRARYGDRTWYRYRAASPDGGPPAAFVRLETKAPRVGLRR